MKKRVLLIGAGTGEATCGILYLASYLRRHGVESWVQLTDEALTERDLERQLRPLIARLKPTLVGISLKWFHHVARALQLARVLRRIDPEVQVALGGNSASFWWKDLVEHVDCVVLGDGEVPLLELARGDASPANVVTQGSKSGALKYVQGTQSDDVFYSDFDEIFVSGLDLASFSGWVAPGKGCGENCLYCSGTRGMQKATFGRATPFLRPSLSVQRDHREIVPRTWQLRYDFAGSTTAFLEGAWSGLDLAGHSTTYFLWGVPPAGLYETLSKNFQRVFVVLDVGCFSESQRLDQIRRGLLKPCPTDAELLAVVDRAKTFGNLELEVSGIAGLPFASEQTLDEERRLVEHLLERGCMVGYQRLQAQPGALATEHPERFGMVTEAKSFSDFVTYFEALEPGADTVPMIRYADAKLEKAVQRTSDRLDELVFAQAEARKPRVTSRLVNAAAQTRQVKLGAWLGDHRVPAKLRSEVITVVRSIDGHGLALAPRLRGFKDASVQTGRDAEALLQMLEAFKKPSRPNQQSRDVLEYLVAGRFLQPA